MKKVLAVLSILLIAAAPAFAYDSLVSGDTSAVKEAGAMCASAQLLYLTADDMLDKDGESVELADTNTNYLIPVKFRYGIMDKLEAFGVLNLYQGYDTGATDDAGVSDLWLGAKYGVMDDGLLTVRGALLVPLGDDEKGLGYAGGFGVDVAALTTYQMEAVTLNGQAGLRFAAEDSDTKMQPGLGIWLDGEGSYAINDALSCQLGLELLFQGDSKFDGDDVDDSAVNWYELNVGAKYMMGDNMAIKGDILYDLGGKMTNQDLGVLIGFMYGF